MGARWVVRYRPGQNPVTARGEDAGPAPAAVAAVMAAVGYVLDE